MGDEEVENCSTCGEATDGRDGECEKCFVKAMKEEELFENVPEVLDAKAVRRFCAKMVFVGLRLKHPEDRGLIDVEESYKRLLSLFARALPSEYIAIVPYSDPRLNEVRLLRDVPLAVVLETLEQMGVIGNEADEADWWKQGAE